MARGSNDSRLVSCCSWWLCPRVATVAVSLVQVELCSPSDLSPDEFATCANRSFPGRKETPEHLEWKWCYNGFGYSRAVVARARTGELLGAIILGQQGVRMPTETISSYCIYDLFVAPESRGQGVYRALLELVPRAAGCAGVLFSFPNQSAMPGQLRAGWKPIRKVHQYSTLRSARSHGVLDVSGDKGRIEQLCTRTPARDSVVWQPTQEHVLWRLENPKIPTYLLEASGVLALVSVAARLGRREMRTLIVADRASRGLYRRLDAIRRMAASLGCSFATTAEQIGGEMSTLQALTGSWFPRPSNAVLTLYEGQKPRAVDYEWIVEGGMIHTW